MNLRGIWERVRAYYASRSRNDQRVMLGLVVITVLSLLYVGVWVPVRDYRAQVVAEIEQGQEDLQRSARFLGSADALRAERDALKKKLDLAKKELLPGNSGTLGAAALQEQANQAATEKGVSVQSTQVMKEETLEPYRRVAIRMTLSSELRALAEFISTLEYTHHLVLPFVEISRRGAVAAGAKGPRTLQATVEVAGFVLGSKDAEAAEPAADGGAPAGDGAAAPEDGAPPPDGTVVAPVPAAGQPTTTVAPDAPTTVSTIAVTTTVPATAPPTTVAAPPATKPKPTPPGPRPRGAK